MGNCIYNLKPDATPNQYIYSYERVPIQSDELQLPDFVSEISDYDAFIRFHKYPEDVIIKSDVLCYRLEMARERLLWNELQFIKVKRDIRHLHADIKTVRKMDAFEPCEHTFGINPLSILDEQLKEHVARLEQHRTNVNYSRREVDRRYNALMQFWDKEYCILLDKKI